MCGAGRLYINGTGGANIARLDRGWRGWRPVGAGTEPSLRSGHISYISHIRYMA